MSTSNKRPKRERPDSPMDHQPIFGGHNGAECERFIQDFRRKAFAEDRLGDKLWTANFASTCLQGAALRWHASLPEEVQNDWNLLVKELLKKHPSDDADDDTAAEPTSNEPEPSMSSNATEYSKFSVSFLEALHLGMNFSVVVVMDNQTAYPFHVTRTLDESGHHRLSMEDGDELRVGLSKGEEPHGLVTSASIEEPQYLGMTWRTLQTPSAHLARCNSSAGLCTVYHTLDGRIETTSTKQGPSRSHFWNVRARGLLEPVWVDDAGVSHTLDVLVRETEAHHQVFLVPDFGTFNSSNLWSAAAKSASVLIVVNIL